jgi:hypothetical protein
MMRKACVGKESEMRGFKEERGETKVGDGGEASIQQASYHDMGELFGPGLWVYDEPIPDGSL